MDSAGSFILLIVLGLLGFIIYAAKKDFSTEEEHATPTPPPPAPKPTDPAPPTKKEQKYITIYEYTSVKNVKRCAYCDGENKYGAKVCRICGNDIDS